MKFDNFKAGLTRTTATILLGTMFLGLPACGNDDIGSAYVDVAPVDERITDYLEFTKEYRKAKEIYESYPITENLQILSDKTTDLINSMDDKLQEKLGMNFWCFVSTNSNGDRKYIIQNLDNKDIVYTHVITNDNQSYGEINSSLILEFMALPDMISKKNIQNWNEQDIKNFINILTSLEENIKNIFLIDFEIKEGNIYEVKLKIKKKVK